MSGAGTSRTPEPLEVLFRDQHVVVVNKPAGLLVHRTRIDRYETRFALQMVRDQIGRRVYPVHRLDKPTSGTLLFALHPEAARRFTDLFAQRAVDKVYLAVVRGYTAPHGVVDHPLKEVWDKMTDRKADPNKGAQEAVTHYRRLATVELPYAVGRYLTSRYALLEARPKTGRKHQIRRHMKHLSHPIIGDGKYGKGRHNRFFKASYGCSRLLLAATELSFRHPYTEEELTVVAPLDEAFSCLIAQLGWEEEVPLGWRRIGKGREANDGAF